MPESFLGGRGDYFAEGDYLATDVRTGVTRDRAGARVLALPEDFLTGLGRALGERCGPAAGAVRKACGREYGRRLAARLAADLEEYYGEALPNYPLARLEGLLVELFSHHGWGRPRFDFSRYATGLIVVAVDDPADGDLLAGVLAGLFSHLASEGLDCLATQREPDTRFVVTVPERLKAVSEWPDEGRAHDEIVRELEATRV
jgi:hypothetical protein